MLVARFMEWLLDMVNGDAVCSASEIYLDCFLGADDFIISPLRSPKAELAAWIAAERDAPKS